MRRLGALVLTALVAFAYCSDVALARTHPRLALARAASAAPQVVTTAKPGTDAYELAQIGGYDPSTIPAALVSPVPSPQPAIGPAAPADLAPADFFADVLATIKALGGVSMLMKISLIITLLISALKVSALRHVVWAHVGAAQPWVAPFLGFLAGVTGLGAGGAPVTPALVFAYAFAGGGAVFVHEALDSLKTIPGLGTGYVAVIDALSRALGGTTKPGEPPIVTPPRG